MDIFSFVLVGIVVLFVIGIFKQYKPKVFDINTPYISEADIVKKMGWSIGIDSLHNFPSNTIPAEEIGIKVYRDTEDSLANYKTFDFDYTDKKNPLLEKELFKQLEKVLQEHEMIRVKKDPQTIISMNFFIGKKEQYTPPTTVTNTEIKRVWNTAIYGWDAGGGFDMAGFTQAVPVTSSTTAAGYTTTTYYINIRLNFLNHAKLMKNKKLKTPPLIWLGEVESGGLNSDIREKAPIMFSELMGLFSDQSANSANCYVSHFRYGGLGLGFGIKDWRVIRYVEPSSVATENGIKPGDVLVRINGKNPNRSFTFSNFPSNSKDPYFQNVLSNHGNSDVNVTVRKAETGRTVTIKMRPRSENRYVHVTI